MCKFRAKLAQNESRIVTSEADPEHYRVTIRAEYTVPVTSGAEFDVFRRELSATRGNLDRGAQFGVTGEVLAGISRVECDQAPMPNSFLKEARSCVRSCWLSFTFIVATEA